MQIKQPLLCERCLALFSLQLESDSASCRIETWWCAHSAALAICVVNGRRISHMTVQGPLTDAEAFDRIRDFTDAPTDAETDSSANLRQPLRGTGATS